MQTALSLARRGLGRTAPNPSVACVIVKDGIVIARGVTGDGGRPHAEAVALVHAGAAARDATAYVTLEPCAHHGQTGPCAEALVKAAVARVIIACGDPDPRVSGKGIEILKSAGIEVVTGVMEDEARELNKGFILRVTENRPLVTLKIAVTNDGMVAPANGRGKQITGEMAHRHVHLERSLHDAILTGIGTVLNDNPLLTTRVQGITYKAPRIILDSQLKIPVESQLVRTANDAPVWVFYKNDPENKIQKLEKAGVQLFNTKHTEHTEEDNQNFACSVCSVLKKLAEEGITRLLVEGGPAILKSFIEARLCDRFLLYKAPNVTWPGGKPLGFTDITAETGLKCTETLVLGEDLLEIYTCKA